MFRLKSRLFDTDWLGMYASSRQDAAPSKEPAARLERTHDDDLTTVSKSSTSLELRIMHLHVKMLKNELSLFCGTYQQQEVNWCPALM